MYMVKDLENLIHGLQMEKQGMSNITAEFFCKLAS